MIAKMVYKLYAFTKFRPIAIKLLNRFEGGEMFSPTLRKIFNDYHKIKIGMYSYGCFNPINIGSFTNIGRYCSFAAGVCIFNANHPLKHKSLHPFFYNTAFGFVSAEQISRRKITIKNDVWVGRNALITSSVNTIGNGAAIGAGAVVTKNVPDFAVVVGNPARIIKYRFDKPTIMKLLKEKWWEKDIDELNNDNEIKEFMKLNVENKPE